MGKFKLVKEYPGSPELGAIRKDLDDPILSKYFTTYPEFWEEVVEKDYEILISRVVPQEILSVKRLSDGEVFTVGDLIKTPYTDCTPIVGFKNPEAEEFFIEISTGFTRLISLEKIIEKDYEIISYVAKDNPNNITTKRRGAHLHEEYWTIHSVKRLSDGEIFTIGDKITGYHKDIRSIQKIRICPYIGVIRLEQSGGYTDLRNATKVYPIFLTHDGKDIFEGDKIWYVNKENLYYDYAIVISQTSFNSNTHAYFLTRVEAEEYIAKNKPLFISEGGYDIKEGDMYYFVDTDFSVNIAKALKGCGQYSERKYFATLAAAENCAIQHSRVLSIEDFNNAITSQYGNYNVRQKLIQIVRERLNLK